MYENGGHTLPRRGGSFLWGIKGFFSLQKWLHPVQNCPDVGTSFTHVNDPHCEFLLNHHFDVNKLATNDSKPAW